MKKLLVVVILIITVISLGIEEIDSEDSYKLLGDFNGDNYVDILDLSLFANHYRTEQGEEGYDVLYDIAPAELGTGNWSEIYSLCTPDGIVDIRDLSIFANNYRKYKPDELPDNSLSINDKTFNINSINTIEIYAKTIDDLKGIQLEIYYDTDYFEEVENADISVLNEEIDSWLKISDVSVPGIIIYALAGKTPVNITGENIIQITFTTKNNTGTTEVTFGSETKCSDSNNQNLNVNISDIGNIKIQ